MDRLDKIHRRQVARFLGHLDRTGRLTPELESDVKRAYGYVFEDVRGMIVEGNQGPDKEITGNDDQNP